MDEQLLVQLEETLIVMRKDLQKRIKERSEKVKRNFKGDVGDSSLYVYNRETLYSITERERNKLQEVNDALYRIKMNTYGICDKCGAEISKERLILKPTARFCARCKKEIDGDSK
ncbi:MAG: TraR/DksA family transcriptional regulator [Campylobacterota bacterium]|nr:TraR/DksA family transcriptional regulator [Campylobacterota bacterium]